MRTGVVLTLMVAAFAGTPVKAATIIQEQNLTGNRAFDGFSSSLGMLNSVISNVMARTDRQFFVNTSVGSSPNTITYVIDS